MRVFVEHAFDETHGACNHETVGIRYPDMPTALVAAWSEVESGISYFVELGLAVGLIDERMGKAAEDFDMLHIWLAFIEQLVGSDNFLIPADARSPVEAVDGEQVSMCPQVRREASLDETGSDNAEYFPEGSFRERILIGAASCCAGLAVSAMGLAVSAVGAGW